MRHNLMLFRDCTAGSYLILRLNLIYKGRSQFIYDIFLLPGPFQTSPF